MVKKVQTLKEDEKKPTRYYSKKQEDSIARSLGGKRQPNSGATMFAKSDVSIEDFLVEAKTSTKSKGQITIHKSWLEKTEKEALFMGKKYTALAFNFGPDEPNQYIISEDLFKTLVEKVKCD